MTLKKKIFGLSALVVLGSLVTVYFLTRPPVYNLDQLNINIGESDYDILEQFRENALNVGHLDRSPDDFVPATFQYNNDDFTGKLRLKGDYLDHLKENKWSFRIKLDEPMQDGLQVFSVQNPESRGFLNSYVYHQLLREEGVLSNEIRFVEVIVNGDTWGIYCLEEHLATRMMTSQNKPNGVLLKFTDNSFFAAGEGANSDGLIKEAKIKLYGDLKKDNKYKKDVKLAKKIIKNYQSRIDSSYSNFNAEQTGRYYALCDLATAYHAMGWINVRFYFNFETKKMEPVGYDGYPVLEWGKPYLGKHVYTTKLDSFETKMIIYSALKNDSISSAYYTNLERISQPEYIQAFMDRHRSDLKRLEFEIQKEYDYQYNFSFIEERGKEIQSALE